MNFKLKNRVKIPRNKYGYLTSTSTGGGSGTDTSSSSTTSGNGTASNVDCKIWGQHLDGSTDVDGKLSITEGDIEIKSGDVILDDGNIDVEGEISAGTTNTDYIYSDTQGTIAVEDSIRMDSTLQVQGKSTFNDDITTTAINSENHLPKTDNTYTLGSLDKQWKEIYGQDAYLQNLTVYGSAHFFELTIDKIKSVGGAVMFTPANGFEITNVVENTDSWELQYKCEDGNGNYSVGQWKIGDQALCKNFNKAQTGTSSNVDNKYYWALVVDCSNEAEEAIDSTTGETTYYHYITISKTTAVGTVNPEVGDTIVMCGYRGTDDTERQSAIYISAYDSLDSGIKAPLFACYQGINDFDLSSHRKTYFDATSAKFVGDFEVGGQSVQDYINGRISTAANGAPYIGSDGYWYAYDSSTSSYKSTGIKAAGTNGENAKGYDIAINYVRFVDEDLEWEAIGYEVDGSTRSTVETQDFCIKIRKNNDGSFSENWYAGTSGRYCDSGESATDDEGNKVSNVLFGLFDSNGELLVSKNYSMASDAELYQLYPVAESALVNDSENLGINFSYLIEHIKGDTRESVNASANLYIRYKDNTQSTWTVLPYTSNPTLTNDSYQTSYYTTNAGNIKYFDIQLCTPSTVLDRRVVNVQTTAGATFKIKQATDSTIASIESRVSTTEGNYSSLSQTATNLTTRVGDAEGNISTLQSTSESISLKVDNVKDGLSATGIDIEKGQITLDADNTTINGTLTIDSNNNAESLTFVNSDGDACVQIQNTQIGSALTSVVPVKNGTTTTAHTGFYYLTPKVIAGTIAKNNEYTISRMNVSLLIVNSSTVPTGTDLSGRTSTWQYSIRVYAGDTLIKTIDNVSLSHTAETIVFDDDTYTGKTLYLQGAASITSSTYIWQQNTDTWSISMYATVSKAITKITLIGDDGMVSYQDTDKYFKLTTDGVDFKWDNQGFRLNSNGLQRYNEREDGTSYYGGLNRYNVKRLDSTAYTLSNYLQYDLIIFTSSDTVYFGLDTTPAIGHTIRFKKINSGHLYICPRGQSIYLADNHTIYNASSTTSFDIGDDTWEITYIGNSEWVAARMN